MYISSVIHHQFGDCVCVCVQMKSEYFLSLYLLTLYGFVNCMSHIVKTFENI